MSKCSLIIHWPEQFEITKVVSARKDAIIWEADSKQYDITQRSQLAREKEADPPSHCILRQTGTFLV